jgi:transglutaminase-like putative cysteine protease
MHILPFSFRRSSWSLLAVIVAAIVCAGLTTPAWGVGFQPVSPDELKMTSEPKAPGVAAIILYRQVDRDDRPRNAHEDVYFRIKIFTDEGRKYADIEIPYLKEQEMVGSVHARTIKPDGSIIDFGGKVFDKMIVKARGVKYMAKTFTLPDVQAGGIIEYYYTTNFDEKWVGYPSHWILSSELFTKRAKFWLKPYDGDNPPLYMRWTWSNLPPGTARPTAAADRVVSMEVDNIPAFPTEDYMPPADELKSRVDFIYSEDRFEQDADKYWKKVGKKRNDRLENFLGRRKAMEDAVAGIVAPGDSPQAKLEKIYARVQQLRNTSYEAAKTEQEQKRENEKEPGTAEEMWKKQYGSGVDLTWLFLGLARAAGFEASGTWVSDRKRYFFYPQTMEGGRLNSNVVVVKLDGKDVFFDPGSAFVPFGILPWPETGVQGLKLDKDGGSWLQTTLPYAKESQVQHKAELHLTDTGDLEGKLTVTFTGLEAAERRVEERLADDTERKKFLEDEVKESIPAASEAELTNSPDWKSSTPLVAEFTLKVPGWMAGAGRRELLPVGLFSAQEKHVFDHSDRVHPIYIEHPFERVDDISIDLPLGWQIGTLPAPKKENGSIVVYTMQAENNKGTLHLTRSLDVDFLMIDQKYYPALREFFQIVRADDEQQVILQPVGANASK